MLNLANLVNTLCEWSPEPAQAPLCVVSRPRASVRQKVSSSLPLVQISVDECSQTHHISEILVSPELVKKVDQVGKVDQVPLFIGFLWN